MFAQTDVNSFDCLIVGGGLAGGMLLHALKQTQPHLRVLLVERGAHLGGNHTWSFHGTDVSNDIKWLTPMISKTWPGYEVHFPRHSRVIHSSYNSIRSEDFDRFLRQSYEDDILLNAEVIRVQRQSATLVCGKVLQARVVIDARGWKSSSKATVAGYQKFVGLDLRLKKPHGLEHVLLKDVRVPQTDGYRFFYVLPWGPQELLVEDTYYSNSADLDVETVRAEILRYVSARGWEIESIGRQEVGCLPLELRAAETDSEDEVLRLGAAAGVYQPVTGYTFPQTLERVQALASSPVEHWETVLTWMNRNHRRQAGYLRALNRMMFLAAVPEKRYVILERFYGLSEGLIARFYRGRLSLADKVRILCGRPPVGIWRALKSLIS